VQAQSSPEAPKAPVQKERTVIVRVPVILKETVFYPDGLVDQYMVYTWDASKQKLLTKVTFDPSRIDPVEKVQSDYGVNGLLVAETTYGSDGAVKSRREVTYGDGPVPLLLSERGFDAKGILQFSSTWEYDKKGNRTVWKAFDSRNALKAITNYSWDTKDRLVSIELRNGANILTGTIKVEYSADGTGERRSYLASDGVLQKYELSLLKDGRVVRFEIRRADDSLAEASDFTLGPLGERLAAVTMDGSGKVKEKRNAEFAVREDQKTEIYFE
jgi:hypothetical protein